MDYATISTKLPLDTIENCRDLGGIPTEGNRRIKPGLLFRSADLHAASDADLERLRNAGLGNGDEVGGERINAYPVGAVIDLRTLPERHGKPDRLLANWKLYETPVFYEAQVAKSQIEGMFAKPGTFMAALYPAMAEDDSAKACWGKLFSLVAGHPGAYLWHCTQGKDRTGIAAALIEAALGADTDTIRADYLQTNLYMAQDTPKVVETLEAALPGRASLDIEQFLVAAPQYFDSFLEATERYGGLLGYVQQALGVGDGQIAAMRGYYTEPAPQQ